VIRAEL